jgi:phosphatidylglycerophosphate synthase
VYITPNIITMLSVLVTVLIADGVLKDRGIILLSMLVNTRTVLDLLDGEMARYYQKTSQLGAILDTAADIFYNFTISYTFIYKYSQSFHISQMTASCVLTYMCCENLYKETKIILYKLNYEREQTFLTILIHDNFTPPKRRFWKVGRTFQNVVSKQFSTLCRPNTVLTPLKSASKPHSEKFVRPSKIFVWGA